MDKAAAELDAALNAANQAYGNASIQCSLDFGRPLATYKYVSCYFGGNGHRGTDYAAPGGTEIYAVSGGVVTAAAYHWSWGYYVQVYHGKDDNGNTYSTLYAHMNSAPVVSVGQPVEKGKVLGYVGSTGNSTGNHLHLEMKVNNVLGNLYEAAEAQNLRAYFLPCSRRSDDTQPFLYGIFLTSLRGITQTQ